MQLDLFSDANNPIIAVSEKMLKIVEDIEKIAKSSANVFISGESGTGKEVIAKLIHAFSKRKQNPFIRVNCAALPDTLIESEFFGHEKGAFTGAMGRRLGRFELAHLGTLLLDEVSEIPLHLQAKLLRAVQEQEFERLGGMSSIKVDVRLISTSNRVMKSAIEEKSFREDLYYRLNVIPIHLPPLRERKEDILPLAIHFLKKFCAQNQIEEKTFSTEAKEKLLDYSWPGNIRELSNTMEHLAAMNLNAQIESQDITLDLKNPSKEVPDLQPGTPLKELEKVHILNTLKSMQNNKSLTAKALGITTRTLRNKLKEYAN